MAITAAYDLFVLLDLESPDERRSGVIDQIRSRLQERGSLKGDVDWGTRRLAYEIDHRGEAQYHLFQFEAAAELLSELDRTLSIEDAVIRHRIIRLPGEAPDTPPKPSADEPRRTEDRGERGGRGRGARSGPPSEQTSEAPAGQPADAPAAAPDAGDPPPAESQSSAAPAPEAAPAAAEPAPAEEPVADAPEQG